jgi:hypothetical protein
MNTHAPTGKLISWRRLATQGALTLTLFLLTRDQSGWGRAMRSEAQHIRDDKEALGWALGALRAGAGERIRTVPIRKLISARAVGLLWIVIFIASSAFNIGIALTARLGYARATSALGWWLKGFQYERFVDLANAMPVGLFLVMGFAFVAFVVSLYLNILKHRAAFPVFCAALGLSLISWLYQLGIPAYLSAISLPHRWRIGSCFTLTAVVLTALRYGNSSIQSNPHRLQRG